MKQKSAWLSGRSCDPYHRSEYEENASEIRTSSKTDMMSTGKANDWKTVSERAPRMVRLVDLPSTDLVTSLPLERRSCGTPRHLSTRKSDEAINNSSLLIRPGGQNKPSHKTRLRIWRSDPYSQEILSLIEDAGIEKDFTPSQSSRGKPFCPRLFRASPFTRHCKHAVLDQLVVEKCANPGGAEGFHALVRM